MSHLLGEVIALVREVELTLGEAREPVVAFAEADGEARALPGEAFAVLRRLQPALNTFHPHLAPVIKAVGSSARAARCSGGDDGFGLETLIQTGGSVAD